MEILRQAKNMYVLSEDAQVFHKLHLFKVSLNQQMHIRSASVYFVI